MLFRRDQVADNGHWLTGAPQIGRFLRSVMRHHPRRGPPKSQESTTYFHDPLPHTHWGLRAVKRGLEPHHQSCLTSLLALPSQWYDFHMRNVCKKKATRLKLGTLHTIPTQLGTYLPTLSRWDAPSRVADDKNKKEETPFHSYNPHCPFPNRPTHVHHVAALTQPPVMRAATSIYHLRLQR